MSTKDLMIAPAAATASNQPGARPVRFDLPKSRNFTEKSFSEDTCRAYTRALLDFFSFVRKTPASVEVEDVIAYRAELIKKQRRKPRTVSTKLSIIRAYFNYLKAAGLIEFNSADARLVSAPPPPDDMAGRALTAEEVVRLLNAPIKARPAVNNRPILGRSVTASGARDHALLLTLARTSLRVSEVRNLRTSSIVWSHGRWTGRIKVKGGRERTIPFPNDVKQAIDRYLKQDAGRRNLNSDGDDAFIFQPTVNFRTLEFDRPLSARHICEIVNRWAWFAGLNRGNQSLLPHDLRRTAVTRALSLGFSYRQVQSMTGHKDIRMVVKYDHERGNMNENAINFLHYDEKHEK
jgi:site-specific recombinase XerD